MDADFSHQVNDLKALLLEKDEKNIILGSRYVSQGKVLGWSKEEVYYQNMLIIFRVL